MKEKTFREYFKLPLFQDDYAPYMVFDSDNNRAFDILVGCKETQLNIVKKLNGLINNKMEGNLTHEEGEVYIDEVKLLRIRSWGRLTGTGGGLGLKPDTAAKIQDEFAEWIINRLKQ